MSLAVARLESFLNSIAHTISINGSEFPYIEFGGIKESDNPQNIHKTDTSKICSYKLSCYN